MEDDSKIVVTNILFGTVGDLPWGLDIKTENDTIIRCSPIVEFSSSQQRPYHFRFTARTPTDNFLVDIIDQGNSTYIIRTDSHPNFSVMGGIQTNIIAIIPETLIDRLQTASHEFPLQQTLISLVADKVASGASVVASGVAKGVAVVGTGISRGAGVILQGLGTGASIISTRAPPLAIQARQAAYVGASRAGQAVYSGASQAGQAMSQAGQALYSSANTAFSNVSAYLTPYSDEDLVYVKEYMAEAKLYTAYYFPKGYDIVKLLVNKTPVQMYDILQSISVEENETELESREAERKIALGGKNASLVPFNSYPANLVDEIPQEIKDRIRSAQNRQQLGTILKSLQIVDGKVSTIPVQVVRGRRGSSSR
jgi:hypothetical protein